MSGWPRALAQRPTPAGALHGEIEARDRSELLLDAAKTRPTAFAPRVLFALPGLSGDEPMGKDFRRASEALAAELLWAAAAKPTPTTLRVLLEEAARLWGLAPAPVDEASMSKLQQASRVVTAVAGAVITLAVAMTDGAGFDLADQVVLVSETPAVRQLLGLAVAWKGSNRQVRAFSKNNRASCSPFG